VTTIPAKVQITFLLDMAAALPNRDQNGRAKRIPYGDAVRQRISSQCFKSALRSATYLVRYDEGRGIVSDTLEALAGRYGLGVALRSRAILSRKVLPMLAESMGEERAVAWVELAKGLFAKAKQEDGEDGEDEVDDLTDKTEDGAEAAKSAKGRKAAAPVADSGRAKHEPGFTSQPIVLGQKEVAALVETIRILDAEGVDPTEKGKQAELKKSFSKFNPKPKGKAEQAINNLIAITGGDTGSRASNAGIDGAFFGRFSTADFVGNVDSAVHVAHLIGVNPIAAVPDYFSVQDSILKGEESGGAHQNTSELASSLFLGTIVVDVKELALNLGLEDADAIAECVAWIVRSVHSVNPAAKLGSTAPYGNVVETVVEIGSRQPRSHVVAFQKALRPESLKDRSLSDEAARILVEQVETSGRRLGAQKHVLRLSGFDGDGNRAAFENLALRTKELVAAEIGA